MLICMLKNKKNRYILFFGGSPHTFKYQGAPEQQSQIMISPPRSSLYLSWTKVT